MSEKHTLHFEIEPDKNNGRLRVYPIPEPISHEEWEAKSLLITAAPELLAALKELSRRFKVVTGGDEKAQFVAQTAIAKAEGRNQ